MKKNPTQYLDSMMETDFGLFVCSLRILMTGIEKAPGISGDEKYLKIKNSLESVEKRIQEMTDTGSFPEGKQDRDFIEDLFEVISEPERDAVMMALKSYKDTVGDSIGKTGGKKKAELEYRIDRLFSIMSDIFYSFYDLGKDLSCEKAFAGHLDDYVSLFGGEFKCQNPELVKAYEGGKSMTQLLRDEFKNAGPDTPPEQTLHAFCDRLPKEERDFLLNDIIPLGEKLLMKDILDIRKEYAGMDMDFSKYEVRLAALTPTRRTLAKRYRES